jgi:lysozyme
MNISGNTDALQAAKARRQQRFVWRNIILGVAAATLLGMLTVYELDYLQDSPTSRFVPAGSAEPAATQPQALQPADDDSGPASDYHGIDISHYQGDFESEITPEDGLTFVICKATQGTNFVDGEFDNNWTLAKNKGLIRGCYHFFSYGQDPVAQADYYVSTVGHWGPEDIAPIIDLEGAGIPHGTSPAPSDYQAAVKAFLNTVENACNCTPMIYTGKYFVNQYLNDPYFAKYPLWFAEYTTAEQPALPTIWKKAGYKIWQKSDTYDANATSLDFDIYHGPKSGLWQK